METEDYWRRSLLKNGKQQHKKFAGPLRRLMDEFYYKISSE